MKKILISGATGFIGNIIFTNLLKKKYLVEGIDLRQAKKNLEKIYEKKYFDIFIHSAGIHPHSGNANQPEIYNKTKEILKKAKIVFLKSKKIILISSFVNLINKECKIIKETNNIISSKNDNYYKKSKILTEKYFNLLNRKYKKDLIIIYPCHVIGPGDYKKSPNGVFFIKYFSKRFSLYSNVSYPITDVREIANFIIYCIKKNLSSKKKILIDKNIYLSEFFSFLKSYKKKISFYVKINFRFYIIAHYCFKFISIFFNLKKEYFPISTYYYLKLNPKVIPITDDYKSIYKIEDTVKDTIKYFNL